jgi:hypothetical protein
MKLRVALASLSVSMGVASSAPAQNAVVYYDHRPGDTTAAQRVTYLLPGEHASLDRAQARRHVGLPPMLNIAQGSSVCVVVENANPLLYSYTAASKTITVEPPAELAPLLTSFTQIIDAVGGKKFLADEGGDPPLIKYADSVHRLARIAKDIGDVKARSDGMVTLAPAAREADSLLRVGRAVNEEATKLFNANSKDSVFQLIREVHVSNWNRLQAAAREITEAHAAGDPTFCTALEGNRIRTTLSVARKVKLGEGQTAVRPVRDSVTSVVSNPISIRVFEVLPAAMFSVELRDRRRFGVQNGVVTSRPDHRALTNAGVFALARISGPLWGTLGVAKGEATAPDLFLGFSLRGGESVVGTNMILGFGLSLAQVAVGLKEGSEGAPLPANVSDVEKIIDRDYRPGFGLILTVSGLSFVKKDKTEEKK